MLVILVVLQLGILIYGLSRHDQVNETVKIVPTTCPLLLSTSFMVINCTSLCNLIFTIAWETGILRWML